ncbi:MAG: chemotaxis protein CheA [Nitrospirae bacterium]|nr:chemotaxis protein CheA [Nitrospirota bacterium]
MADEMDEIIGEFITEAEESLDKIDPLFIELEAKGYDKEMLNEIFRSMHTIKGAAGFLGFKNIVEVAHKSESILKRLRDLEITMSTKLMDAILRSVDMLKLLLHHLKIKDAVDEDINPLITELDNALRAAIEAGSGQPVEDVPTAGWTEPPPARVLEPPAAEQATEPPIAAVQTPEPPPKKPEAAPVGAVREEAAPPAKMPSTLSAQEALQTLRVDVERVDKVMDLTGEMVLVRNRLLNIANYLESRYSDDQNVEHLLGTVAFLDLVTSDMQLAVMKMRMQPLKKVFGKFPRLVRDLSNNIGKDVDLVISGEDTEVDRTVIEHIGDPMVHIIRNAIDHGLESRDDRARSGKPVKGTLSIRAFQQGNQIIIEVADDGKGIDVERVKRKAIEKMLITEEEAGRMADENAINLIFLPGFSTMEKATELSGRGVGMDVVKTNISKLNGYVEIMSKKGIGSTFRISIPLTLAILQALMVRAGSSQFAIPLAPVEETIKVERRAVDNVTGQKVLVVREKVCPLFELTDILNLDDRGENDYRYVLVITIGDRRFCIAVDELMGQEEVVIKTINGIETDSSYILGATITGEGKVVLILDLAGISRKVIGALKV